MILRYASSCPIFPVNSAKVTHLAEHVYFKSTAYLAVWTLTFSFHLSWPLPGQSSGMLVPWILSAVDVGPGGCFQARSILNAFAKTRGAPWLSESGWDTAHSISCWPMATRAGQPGLQPASTWLSLQTPARSMEPGSGQQDLPRRSANGNKQCRGRGSAGDPKFIAGQWVSFNRPHTFAVLYLCYRVSRIGNTIHCFKSTLLLRYLLQLPIIYKIGKYPFHWCSRPTSINARLTQPFSPLAQHYRLLYTGPCHNPWALQLPLFQKRLLQLPPQPEMPLPLPLCLTNLSSSLILPRQSKLSLSPSPDTPAILATGNYLLGFSKCPLSLLKGGVTSFTFILHSILPLASLHKQRKRNS